MPMPRRNRGFFFEKVEEYKQPRRTHSIVKPEELDKLLGVTQQDSKKKGIENSKENVENTDVSTPTVSVFG